MANIFDICIMFILDILLLLTNQVLSQFYHELRERGK